MRQLYQFFSEIAQRLTVSDFYVTLPFWGYFAAAVIVYRLAQSRPVLSQFLLLACSVCMLLTLPRFDFEMLVILLGVCAATYVCAKVLLGDKCRRPGARKSLATFAVVANVAVLAFFKYSFVQNALLLRKPGAGVAGSDFIFLIGISYTAFRAIHFVIEAYKKNIQEPNLLKYLNYMLFFPAFISGPIHRYNHFCQNSPESRNAGFRSDLAAGMERIIHGLFKKAVLTVLIFPYSLNNLGVPVHDMSDWQILLGLYAFALYLYFDFSGYTDLAIGSARIMGFVLPENFNRPFLKENIQKLWANWHISLSSWLTDYIYWPIVRGLREGGFLRTHPLLLSNAAILVTFLVCGIWHGDTLNFVLWGLYHGVGISAVNTYQHWKRKARHPLLRKYFASDASSVAGVALTFHFFIIGLLPFVLNSEQIRVVLGRFI